MTAKEKKRFAQKILVNGRHTYDIRRETPKDRSHQQSNSRCHADPLDLFVRVVVFELYQRLRYTLKHDQDLELFIMLVG